MKVLITGANGYVGKRLLQLLVQKGHHVVCLVHQQRPIKNLSSYGNRVTIITGDLLKSVTIQPFPADIDCAYYVVNAKLYDSTFLQLEALSAHHFVQALNKTNCSQLVFLNRWNGTRSRRYIEHVLGKAKAVLSFGAAIPYWYLIWPFYRFMFNRIVGRIIDSTEA